MSRYEDTPTVIRGSKTHDFASLADGAVETTTVIVPGAAIGDFVTSVSMSVTLGGCHFRQPAINTANTVSVTLVNNSGGTVNVASGTLSVSVSKRL